MSAPPRRPPVPACSASVRGRTGGAAGAALSLALLLGSSPGARAEPVERTAALRPLVASPAWPSALPEPAWSRLAPLRMTAHARRLALSAMGAMPQLPSAGLRTSGGPALGGAVPLLVRADGGAAALRAAGLVAEPISDTLSEVAARPEDLPALLRHPAIRAIDGARRYRPLLDRSRTLTGARLFNDVLDIRGRGVLIGVVDTGADFRHRDLRRADGSSRIAFLLDAGAPRLNSHPELPDYAGMAVYTQADLDAVLAAEAHGMKPPLRITGDDRFGHGTHVLSITASSGLATARGLPAGRYVGMAPDASLCVVKGTRDDETFSDRDLFTSVRFCFDRAADLRMPVVVNLSLGSSGGAHDGQSLLEQELDRLIADQPGRIVVAASGNSGEDDLHASASLLAGTHEIRLLVKHLGEPAATAGAAFELFHEASAAHTATPQADLTLELRSPSGILLRVPAGQSLRGRFQDEGEAIVDNTDQGAVGLRAGLIQISGVEGHPLLAGDWTLRLVGRTVRYDLWRVQVSDGLDVQLRGHLDPDSYIEVPAGAKQVISVGAERTRLDWLRVDGKVVRFDREVPRVAAFSSGGPLRDGRFAPDLLAPGEFVVAALAETAPPSSPSSAFFFPGDPNFLVADDGLHGVMRGTSQAAPHVSGAVALLLQLDPDLTTSRLRELLRTTTFPTGEGYGPRSGFGMLDLRTTLRALRGPPPGPVDAALSDVGTSSDLAAPFEGVATITVTPRDAAGVPLGPGRAVEIRADAGDWDGRTVDLGGGRYERRLYARGARGVRARITARVDGVELARHPVVDFVGEHSEIGAPPPGACALAGPLSTARGRAARHPALLVLAALLLLGRRRGRAGLALLLGLGAAPGCSDADSLEGGGAPVRVIAVRQSPIAAARERARPGGEFYWRAEGPLMKPSVVIHLGEQRATVYDGETVAARSSVCTGRRSHRTPTGEFTVLEKVPEHTSNRYGDYIDEAGQVVLQNVDAQNTPAPPGTSFRGTRMPYFLRIVGGVGLHAGPLPGYPDSHGCVRFPEPIARRLFDAVAVGTPVHITD
ncbi:MAG: S8 family serine peptidase [Polyangia bacterium]